ncbi:MAG: hypothetical protein AAF098_18395, partial [Pseudomonadota bacterium]
CRFRISQWVGVGFTVLRSKNQLHRHVNPTDEFVPASRRGLEYFEVLSVSLVYSFNIDHQN